MKTKDFLKEKALYLGCCAAASVVTVLILAAFVPAKGTAILSFTGVVLVLGAVVPLVVEYRRKKTFYELLITSFERLDHKNLVSEVLSRPDFWEGALLYDVLKASNKACLEEINHFKNLQSGYREYIELWVHEIKTPISSSKLILQNNPGPIAENLAEELDAIESDVEQALFYARSNAVEHDYLIREVCLQAPVFAVLRRDAGLLIRAGIRVCAHDLTVTVYSDSKWIEFMLHQLITNAVNYTDKADACIEIRAEETANSCVLTVCDNGLGIAASELPKIFDKGFTGTNGRLRGKSTGMGLYICKQLCGKLGISIGAESQPGAGTTVRIVFPKSSMTDLM